MQLLRGIPKPSEILAQDDDNIWAQFLCFSDQLELIEALRWKSAGLHEVDHGLVLLPRAKQRVSVRDTGLGSAS